MSGVLSSIASTVQATQAAGSALSGLIYGAIGTDQIGAWIDQLQPASWRGLGFAVDSSVIRRGRRVAVHEYPFRDDVWVEDLGRGVRGVAFSGFVVGDDCYAQAQALLAASETAGSGELIHPSLGSLTVALASPMEATERKELGRVVEIRFEFVETGISIYPDADLATDDLATAAADDCDSACLSDFLSATGAAIAEGVAVVSSAAATAGAWCDVVEAAAADASLIVGAVTGLVGSFGRYDNGSRTVSQSSGTTTADALAALTTSRAAVSTAAATLLANAGTLSASTVTGSTANSSTTVDNGLYEDAVALTEALRAECGDPADAVRLLSSLASYTPTAPDGTAPIAAAMQTVTQALGQAFRRAALSSLGRACAAYQPTSYDDAVTLRAAVAELFDAEILIAADAEQDASYQALRALRTAVLTDLTTRGADLARLTTVTAAKPLPSLTLAYRLYRDATRSDDLIARADPVAPAWMPTSFQALSS